jgi:hypothetical protein
MQWVIMKLFKSLRCDNYAEINNQIKAFIDSTGIADTTNDFWNTLPTIEFVKATPLFRAWMNSHGLTLHSLALTVGRDAECCMMHTDTPPAKFKLSWPIQNTANTYNRWFKPIVSNPDANINLLGGTAFTNANQFEEIERMEIVGPCIINAIIPHDVWASQEAKYPRLGLQCMLFNEPNEL